MKKGLVFILVLVMVLATTATLYADKPTQFDAQGNECAWKDEGCIKIQSGELIASTGEILTVGFDEFGYNYQGHMFHGRYCDYDRVIGGPSCDVDLMMKWNDAWLANTDCGGGADGGPDGLLDRHHGYPSYIGSGAWLTNHMWGSYEEEGQTCDWDYFVKIVAAPVDGDVQDGYWHAADGTEIGEVIWGAFAVIQQVENDPCAGISGIQYLSPDHAGFGGW